MTSPPIPANQVPLHHVLASPLVTRLARYHGIPWAEITVEPLLEMTEWDLYDVRGIGETYVKAIKEVLAEHGFSLKPNPNDTAEVYLWPGERGRLHRFGEWLRQHPGAELDETLHEFLVRENQLGRGH